jgi:hypothetical protein
MDLAVAVSPRETASGALSPETAAAANATFREHGCVLLCGASAPSIIEDMHGEFVSRFGGMDLPAMQAEVAKPPPNRFLMVGDARYDITLRMTGAFGRPEVFARAARAVRTQPRCSGISGKPERSGDCDSGFELRARPTDGNAGLRPGTQLASSHAWIGSQRMRMEA